MRKINVISLLLMLCLLLVGTESCELLDPCLEVTCVNGGTCDEGVCACPDGFSGTLCEIEDLCVTQNVQCQNDGTCVDGTCECPDGTEGDDCSTLWRDALLGNYLLATSHSSFTAPAEILEISSDIQKFEVTWLDGNGSVNNVFVTLTSKTTFDIPEQAPEVGVTANGTGSIAEDGVVTMNLIVTSANNLLCTFTFTPS